MRARLGAAAASGILVAMACPGPGLWPLAFVALTPLLIAAEGQSVRRGAALGAVTGLVGFALTLRWLAPLSAWGWLALAAYLALYPALFGAVATRLLRGGLWPRAAVPAAWVVLEWARGWVLGGFGWGALGHALAPAPILLQLAALGGVALLSAALAGTATALAAAWPAVRGRAWRRAAGPLALAAAIPLALTAHGAVILGGADGGEVLRIAVVQADLSARDRWDAGVVATALDRYATITDRAIADEPELVLWPETAIPAPLDEGAGLAIRSRALRQRVEEVWRVPLIFGVAEPAPGAPGRFLNAAVLYGPGGVRAPSYHKRRLVPFGEYTPLPGLLGGLERPLPGPEFVFGAGGPPFAVGPARVGVLICFEDVFADEALARAADADLLVILTNDGWFGDAGARQHLAIAQLRAVETGRSIARAANTGTSALIDRRGRIRARAAPGPGHATAALARARHATPFARAPDLVPLALLALVLLALADALGLGARARAARA